VCSAAPWSRVVFTTYALSLTFFETIVLDALVRGGARDILILSDIEGVRSSLSEKGVRGAGRDYQLEPVALTTSGPVFHPKVGVFVGADDAILTVGSGNLTFGGWANNLEVVEFLHPSFAASAFIDAAGFFSALANGPRARHLTSDQCDAVATDLARVVTGQRDRGDVRVLHTLTRSLADQLEELALDLGGATRLAVASPYYDDGSALADLARRFQVGEVFVHRHATVAAGTAPKWPRSQSVPIKPIALRYFEEDGRPLHAKAFEVICRRGRLLVSGSSNASARALGTDGNVEAVTVRIDRGKTASWEWTTADAPPAQWRTPGSETTDEVRVGILRAQLDGSLLSGSILTPFASGQATLSQVTSLGLEVLGQVVVSSEGAFRLEAPDLEVQAWNAGRLVLRVANDSEVAEGYASSAAATAIARRLGTLAPRLFSFLGGSDTPEDVSALLDWIFSEGRPLPGMVVGAGHSEADAEQGAVLLDPTRLIWSPQQSAHGGNEASDARVVARLVDQLRRALQTSKGPYEPPVDIGDDGEEEARTSDELDRLKNRHAAAIARSENLTERFLDWALEPGQVGTWGVLSLELLNHMAQRLDWPTEKTAKWLERISSALTPQTVTDDNRKLVAGALLALVGKWTPGLVRAKMLRLGLMTEEAVPELQDVPLFSRVSQMEIDAAWRGVAEAQSMQEIVTDFVAALTMVPGGHDAAQQDSPLREMCPEEWPVLLGALSNERVRRNVLLGGREQASCPKCHTLLPTAEAAKYRARLVATARNCCQRVIIFGGDEA